MKFHWGILKRDENLDSNSKEAKTLSLNLHFPLKVFGVILFVGGQEEHSRVESRENRGKRRQVMKGDNGKRKAPDFGTMLGSRSA